MIKFSLKTLLLTLSILSAADAIHAGNEPVYNLRVRLDPTRMYLEGWAEVILRGDSAARFTAGNTKISTITVDGKEFRDFTEDGKEFNVKKGVEKVLIHYTTPVRRETAGTGKGIPAGEIDELTFLKGWYPDPGMNSLYNLTVELPAAWDAVSESEKSHSPVAGGMKTVKFTFSGPVPGITLQAGKYKSREELFRGISIKIFFHSGDEKLWNEYFGTVTRNISIYENLIGPFPYKSLSIAEYGGDETVSSPSVILLPSRLIKSSGALESGLRHEIIRQWFGNYIFAGRGSWDWTQGMALFLEGYWNKPDGREGALQRKKIITAYEGLMSGNDDKAGLPRAGYGKAAMFFHILRKSMGAEKFFTALKKALSEKGFQNTGWDDMAAYFPGIGGVNDPALRQWLENSGTLTLKVHHIHLSYREGAYQLDIRMEQAGPVYNFMLPARVMTGRGGESFEIKVDKKIINFTRRFAERPVKVLLDENYDLMRRLDSSEKPMVILSLLSERNQLIVVPGEVKDTYSSVIKMFMKKGWRMKDDRDVLNSDLKTGAVLFLSSSGRTYQRLFAGRKSADAGVSVQVTKNPLNPEKAAMVIDARSESELEKAAGIIEKYGSYSRVLFKNGEAVSRERAWENMGITRLFPLDANGLETGKLLGLDGIVEKIRDREVVFIGESHTKYSHHVMQLEIIRRLYGLKGGMIIGMEMFQAPFQEHLDRYIGGEISEGELLRKTEYFKRWKYDYNLYRDILHFAREKKIPVIALNLQEEITKKVSRGGIDTLSSDDYSRIPRYIDMTGDQYRESMKKVMGTHERTYNFDNFFQAQVLWDETMAHNTAKAMKKYPGKIMVVLAGNGHIQNSWGIPDRVKRLTGASLVTILNEAGPEVNEDSGDFILFPDDIDGTSSPRLNVYLSEEQDGLTAGEIMKDGPAFTAGMTSGDIIRGINDTPISDLADLKIAILDFKKGDRVKVRILRKVYFYFIREVILDLEF